MTNITKKWLDQNPDYTCGCGLYVHPSKRNDDAIHIADCQFYKNATNNELSKRMHLGHEAAPWAIKEVEKLEQLVENISYTAKKRKEKMHLYRDALISIGKWSQEVQDELEKAGLPHAISMWRGCVAEANGALEEGGDAVKSRDPVYPIGYHKSE